MDGFQKTRGFGFGAVLAIGFCACTSGPGSTATVNLDNDASASGSAGAAGASSGSQISSGTASGMAISGAASGLPASGSTGTGPSGSASGASTTGSAMTSGSPNDSGPGDSMAGETGASTTSFPHGPSMGCGSQPPTGVNANNLAIQSVSVTSCGTGPVTPNCVSPDFSPGGVGYIKSGQWDFNNRNYGLQLPSNYNPTTPYPLILEGGGCTGGPTDNGGGYNAGEGGSAIRVGLSYVAQCFADGGVWAGMPAGFGCSPDEAHVAICENTPEVPYINAVLDYLESHLCVDLGKVFIGGYSSGAWESSTVSCALANRIRGMSTTFGGMRIHRPACTGPTAALMLVGADDNSNPIGPLVMGMPLPAVGLSATDVNDDIIFLDSNGSAPMRDELLVRNGCTGTATAMYDAAYPQCVTYTGCPAAYPVVWCDLAGVGHGGGGVTSNGVMYAPAAWNFLSKLPAP